MQKNSGHYRLTDLLTTLMGAVDGGMPIAWCRIIETRGSTPQKPGAVMLVRPDGGQVGTIGGGCVEAEVNARAREALDHGLPQVAAFSLTGDYGWDDGLICGGRMRIAIEPVVERAQLDYFRSMLQLLSAGCGATEAIVEHSSELPGAMLFDPSGRLVASLRTHSSIDATTVADHLKPLSERPRAYAVESVAYVPLYPRCRLLIVGAGHIGQAVARLAAELDFDVWVIDDRSDFASPERFPRAEKIVVAPAEQCLPELEINASCYCLIVTRGHKQDEKALFHLINRGAHYVGLIGSRRKINLIFEDLIEQGVSPQVLSSVHAPVGIDIGSQTVPEIAVSIAAELVAHRNLAGIVPGRPDPVRIVVHEPNSLS